MPDDGNSFRIGAGGGAGSLDLIGLTRNAQSAHGVTTLGNLSKQSTLAGTETPEKLREGREKAATQFEALLLQQMLQSMWKTVPKSEEGLSGSREEELYRDMFTETVAQDIAEKQSFGLKEAVLGEMDQEDKKEVTGSAQHASKHREA